MLSNDGLGDYAHLQQSLVAPEGDLPPTTATPMMEVVAPATLSEGYTFDVDIEGTTTSVTVPKGGVEEGQSFTIPMPTMQVGLPRVNVPVGQWRDGICDCCKYGMCHNHLWTSCCCCLISAGQVITRLQLDWLGRPSTSVAQTTGAFWILFYMTVAYWTSYLVLGLAVGDISSTDDLTPFIVAIVVVRDFIWYSYMGLSIYILYNVRKHVRGKYAIPEHEQCPTGCEDVCCAVCCPHLTAAQLLRHTADYDTYHSSCCTETGVPDSVPSIV